MSPTTTRQEHMDWCKKRALEYCEIGDVTQALASMASDLNKHPDTKGHAGAILGLQLIMSGGLNTPAKMAEFIRRFH
jgi:hypothetical protein